LRASARNSICSLIDSKILAADNSCVPENVREFSGATAIGEVEMKRAWLLLAACAACAGKGPIPAGDKPAWVSTPYGDVRFSPDRFIAQVGSTPVGVKPAPELLATVDAAARAAVAAALTSAISSEVKSYQSAQTGKAGETLSAEQRVSQIMQEFELAAAIEIEGRWREGDTAYAWAVFDKGKALTLQQGKVADHEKQAKDLLAQGEAAEAERPAEALRSYARARTESAASIDGVLLVRALGGKADLSGIMAQAEGKVASLLGELTLSVVEGDQQRAAEGKPLPQPVVFTAWLKGKRAAGLPMSVAIPNGGRASNVTVGPDGKAEVRVDDIGKFAGSEQQIQIAVDWPGLLGVAAGKVPAWIAAGKAGISAVAGPRAGQGARGPEDHQRAHLAGVRRAERAGVDRQVRRRAHRKDDRCAASRGGPPGGGGGGGRQRERRPAGHRSQHRGRALRSPRGRGSGPAIGGGAREGCPAVSVLTGERARC